MDSVIKRRLSAYPSFMGCVRRATKLNIHLHCTALHCTALHWIWIWIWIWIWTACTGAALLRYQHFIEVSALTARKLQLIDCLSVVRASI